MANISVYFKPVLTAGGTTPYFHEFLVYTPDSGSQYGVQMQYFRGGPASNQGISIDSGGGSGSSGAGSGGSGPNLPFGQIITESGAYVPTTKIILPTDRCLNHKHFCQDQAVS